MALPADSVVITAPAGDAMIGTATLPPEIARVARTIPGIDRMGCAHAVRMCSARGARHVPASTDTEPRQRDTLDGMRHAIARTRSQALYHRRHPGSIGELDHPWDGKRPCTPLLTPPCAGTHGITRAARSQTIKRHEQLRGRCRALLTSLKSSRFACIRKAAGSIFWGRTSATDIPWEACCRHPFR